MSFCLNSIQPTRSRGGISESPNTQIDRIFRVIEQPFIVRPSPTPPDPDIQTAPDVFVGYLMLDSLIANTDRHHANWGILLKANREGQRQAELAPTFDHASSLGRELTDASRQEKLRPLRRDQTIIGYLEKDAGRSRIYGHENDPKPLRPLEVFERAHQERRPGPKRGSTDSTPSLGIGSRA